jgi:predicted O-linked N-acetylglucosamine transferase (SPINDLY family)
MFTREGIIADRIELLPWNVLTKGHLDTYNHIDIGLDTFPYNGTTTTCEALWMGVPVITLAGNTHASRVGTSLLSNIGLPELIAETADEYVEIAVNLAVDVQRLQALRGSLQEMMAQSPLTDAKRFTGNLENCYRIIWEKWCKSARS